MFNFVDSIDTTTNFILYTIFFIVYNSPATYFILAISECDGLFLYRRRHKEGVQLKKGGPLPKKGGLEWTPP